MAANERQTAFVNTDGLSTYSNGAVHFEASAQIAIGEASAAQMLALEANDSDRDGLLTAEETSLTTDPNLADSDGDGQNDGFEAAAGTNPLSAASFFAICDISVGNGEVTLQWPSQPGNRYGVSVSPNLQSWTEVASDYPAADPEVLTTWTAEIDSLTGQEEPQEASPFAYYDAQTSLNGNFNTSAFDSVDSNSQTIASRMVQGGSLTGGGADLFVLNRTQDQVYFDGHSDSGWPGFNFGGVNEADQIAAANAGDYFSFTVEAGEELTYESLTFYSNQFGTTGQIDISYTIGDEAEVFIAQELTPATGNVPVTQEMIDFPDFTTSEDVTWTFYLYKSGGENNGIRFDDISLLGSSSQSETILSNFSFTGPPWTAQKEPDFSTFAANAPSIDTATNSVTSLLSNSGFTGGGYNSFYIRDIDGGTVGVADGGDFQIFSTSDTPGAGMNLGNTNATAPTNFISFTVTPTSGSLTFERLTFFTSTNGANDTYDIELRAWDGATETSLGSVSHTSGATSNEPVVLKEINFPDFASSEVLEFRLYGYNVDAANGGIRFDDIKLYGTGDSEPPVEDEVDSLFLRIELQP
ncbi:thrombospondin type 3 repeat-containing protein [Roseibacillus persicicus]|uniref:thrombospondin type 3 repeat-containing protein n=1 Tax=Roseibacillus persicicus TaxID=454148 RepID=UPI00280D7253|nr:thrombospondin type 3 repeat-containing protein [Roseibacillus persicicus]MDQ8189896.1 thrombospondin type 3 repeat-containing protein [Roseibacillus persicicus]